MRFSEGMKSDEYLMEQIKVASSVRSSDCPHVTRFRGCGRGWWGGLHVFVILLIVKSIGRFE